GTLLEGSTDIGGSRASIAMQFAEAFGAPYEDVRIQVVDTESVGYTEVTGGSRVTYATGFAVHDLAQELKRRIREGMAAVWEVPADSISEECGAYRSNGKSASLKQVA